MPEEPTNPEPIKVVCDLNQLSDEAIAALARLLVDASEEEQDSARD